MTKTFEKYVANGVSKQFSFAFPYLHRDDVFVDVDNITVAFTFLSYNIIQLADVPAAGAEVRIQRITPADRPAYDFQLGAPFLPRYIDENFTQAMYAIQEALDAANVAGDRVEGVAQAIADLEDLYDDLMNSQLNINTLDVNNQVGVEYTLSLDNEGDFIRMDNPGENRLIVPPNSSVDFALGTIVLVRQVGAGDTRIVPAGGVVVNAPQGVYNISSKDFGVALVKVGTDEWDMISTIGSAGAADLQLLASEIDNRLQDLFTEVLSADPTFVVNFDHMLRQIDIALATASDIEATVLSRVQAALSSMEGRVTSNEQGVQALEQTTIQHNSRLDAVELATAFTPGQYSASGGYQELPGGLLIQWGRTTDVPNKQGKSVVFPKEFPTACMSVSLTTPGYGAYVQESMFVLNSFTNTGFNTTLNYVGDGKGSNPTLNGYWIAIGH